MLGTAATPDLLELLDTGSPGDIDFYTQYARHHGGPVLVLMCGAGRVAIPIARQGVPVIGVDPDAGVVEAARQKAQQAGVGRVMFVRAEPTNFVSDSRHPLVIIPAGGLQRILTLQEQRQVLQSVRGALALGGRLVLDLPLLDPGPAAAEPPSLHPVAGNDRLAMLQSHRRWDAVRQLVEETVCCDWLDQQGAVLSREYAVRAERYSTPAEVELLLEAAGMNIAFYGGFDRRPLVPGAARIIVEAERKQ